MGRELKCVTKTRKIRNLCESVPCFYFLSSFLSGSFGIIDLVTLFTLSYRSNKDLAGFQSLINIYDQVLGVFGNGRYI